MAYNSHINLTFRGLQGGQVCENQLDYIAEDAVSASYAELVAEFAEGAYWEAIKPLVTPDFQLVQIHAQTIDTFSGGGIAETFTLDVGESGTAIDQALPPNVTVRIVKVANNSTIFPTTATHFRNGFAGFSGIPEGAQANGLLNTSARNAWQAVADTMLELEVTIGGTPYTWALGMHRGELNPPKVLASAFQVSQRLGTRNSRKR